MIPIQNIYYLLCYAWNKLDEKEQVAVSIDDNTTLIDLFAKVLINSSEILLKRGIDRSYIDLKSEIQGLKGKIAVAETVQKNLLFRFRTICTYDEFSADILTNRILISTLRNLLKIKGLDKNHKLKIRQLILQFPQVKYIRLRASDFKKVKLHRNNRAYDFPLKVCQLIHENILPGEEPGIYKFMDFTRNDRKMNQLFEHFIFNFYAREASEYSVKREHINWKLSSSAGSDLKFLPLMKTDISLISKTHKIIIDAKFYRETLAKNYDTEKVKSGNLYQIFSYLLNQEDSDKPLSLSAKGILLYPTTQKELDLVYRFGNHPIEIRTVNLDQDWKGIERRLLEIV